MSDRSAARPRFVPLDAATLASIAFRERDAGFARAVGEAGVAALLAQPGHAWAMLDGGYLLGAGGAIPLDVTGRGALWLTPSIFARPRHVALAVPFASVWIDDLLARGVFRRIEATARADMPQSGLLLRRLGFQCETPEPMRAYGPDGSAQFLFAKVTA